MLERYLKYPLIAVALAAGAAQAGSGAYLASSDGPVRNGYGECWRVEGAVHEPFAEACVERSWLAAEVLFAFERAEVGAQGRKVLDNFAQKLLALEPESVAITAHADRIGASAHNERLSIRRAESIRAFLVEKGVPEKLVRVEGRGAREPLSECDAMGPESRANAPLIACLQPDRRVEIAVTGRRKPSMQ